MNVALSCRSLLLSRALELFLKDEITTEEACDFIISDTPITSDKPVFYIQEEKGDLAAPFSKSALMIALEKFHHATFQPAQKPLEKTSHLAMDIPDALEEKIAALTEKFRQELIETLKAHCGN